MCEAQEMNLEEGRCMSVGLLFKKLFVFVIALSLKFRRKQVPGCVRVRGMLGLGWSASG